MTEIKDICKAFCILEEVGIVFTKEQFDMLYSLEKKHFETVLPEIEKAMRKICASLFCKWSLRASYSYTSRWTVTVPEKAKTGPVENVSIEQAYDQINMLRELGLPVGQEQMANVKAAEVVFVKETIAPSLDNVLNRLIPISIPHICVSFTVKPKGKMSFDIVMPSSQTKIATPTPKTASTAVIQKLPSTHSVNVDVKKLQSVFDKKVTSYKYFWFYSILSLLAERDGRTLAINDIVAKMIATAWPLVNSFKLDFGQADALPKYIADIYGNTYLQPETSQDDVFGFLKRNRNVSSIKAAISKLRKNVPYRFLTPWVKYVSDEQMMSDSISPQSGCPYAIDAEHVTIHEGWHEYLRTNHIQLCSFISQSLSTYLDKFNSKNFLHHANNTLLQR